MAEAAPAAAAAKVKPQVFGVNPVAGIKTQFKVRFSPEVNIPLGSLIQVTFPDGFKVSRAVGVNGLRLVQPFGVAIGLQKCINIWLL